MAVDEYGREPEYAGQAPGNPVVRLRMLTTPGRLVVVRPAPSTTIPAFTNDQPQE